MTNWKKANVENYSEISFKMRWCQTQSQNFRPAGQISSDALLPEDNPWDYLTPETPNPKKSYESDNEKKAPAVTKEAHARSETEVP